jgi:hypothetical protein
MAFEQERERIAQIVDQHSKVPVLPHYSAGMARKIEQRAKVLKIQTPIPVRRLLDRLVDHDSDSLNNKLARDLHGKEHSELTQDQQFHIHRMHNELPGWNPATGSPYSKAGMDFAQAHHLLLASYREQSDMKLPQEMRAYLMDLSHGLEHDLDDAAKKAGFYKEYSDANMQLRIATAGPHKVNQNIPIVVNRR